MTGVIAGILAAVGIGVVGFIFIGLVVLILLDRRDK